jgi:hypothetical protein
MGEDYLETLLEFEGRFATVEQALNVEPSHITAWLAARDAKPTTISRDKWSQLNTLEALFAVFPDNES